MAKLNKTSRRAQTAHVPAATDTPPEPIPLPNDHRETVLPIHAVGSEKYERLCSDVLKYAHPQITRKVLKRSRGQAQFGVDVEGFNAAHKSEVVISCKCWRDVKPRYLLPWTKAFTDHLDGHWQGRGVKVFILAITHPGNSDELTAAVRDCQTWLETFGIRFELWDSGLVTDLLRKEIELVHRYFNEAWVKAVSPQGILAFEAARAVTATAGQSASVMEMARELAAVSRDHDELSAQKIDAATGEYRQGRAAALVSCLDELQHDAQRWSRLDKPVKAKALRARAMLALNADDKTTAGRLLDAADALADPPDRSARAWYIRAMLGNHRAIAFLQSPTTPRELEILAALLIENGDAVGAARLLDDGSTPSTSEQERLKAIALCSAGERETAVGMAAAASAGPAPSFACVQTLATLHVMAALAPGAAMQFGAAPNPFDASLVRVTTAAIAHLDAAIDILERQIPIVDSNLARDLELWKLATLLLHPTKTREARDFAERMLARPELDPLTVAWCQCRGIKLKYWRVRKKLEADLEQGTATPSHVVVLAMLVADRSTNAAAAAVVAKYRPKFSDADAFLLDWQRKFDGDISGDGFASAMRDADGRNYTALAAFLDCDQCNTNQLLTGAAFLAMRKEWAIVNALRAKLIAAGTPRAIDLAARSAFETGASADTIDILDNASAAFADGELNESLRYLRSRAHDRLGNKGAAITDLENVATRTGDPAVQSQLIHSLINSGRLHEARDQARSYVALPSTKPIELVQLAHVFKRFDMGFSRSLIEIAADHPKLPKRAAPGLMTLASTLGLDAVQNRMMAIIADITKDGSAGGIIRFDNVEDVIAFMKERGDKLQEEYDVWHAGMKPAHVTFAGDTKSFSALYLADPVDRFNALNKPLPMLVRAANAAPRMLPAPAAGVKLKLIIDISALLLAARCDLLDLIDTHYAVQIPEAVPMALVDIEDEWPRPSQEYAAAARAWLANTETAVQVVDDMPANAVPVGTAVPPFELIRERLAEVGQLAIAAGELSPADAAAIVDGREGDTAALDAPMSAIALEPWTLVRLQQRQALEPFARSIPAFVTVKDRDELAQSLARLDRQDQTRRQLTVLRERVGLRLASGAWTTLPHTSSRQETVKLSPHLQSLIEIIDAVQGDHSITVWVEDRALSRSRLPALVNILDVANDLLHRGAIDAQRYWAIDQQLRDMGVAFMPIPVTQIAGDVMSAPVTKGVLVETPALTKWRCWYAEEVTRLGLANQAPEPDGEGRIAGEPRYLLDLLATARNVLGIIWSDTDSSNDDKRARSDWIWTCLRFEVSPALQWSTANEEARRTLMATVLFHTADLPLMARLNTDVLPKAAHQPFMDWFVSSALANRCAVDPALADNFARQMASLIVPQLARDPDLVDEVAEQARIYMAQVFQRYLHLFPAEWRDRITSHHDLAAKLGFVSVMTLRVGEADIPAEAIEAAIASGQSQVSADRPFVTQIPVGKDRGASLKLSLEPSGGLAAAITYDGETAHLDPFLVAVTLPNTASRLEALRRAASPLDLGPDQLAAAINEIGAPDTIAERVGRQQAAYDRDFVRRLAHVRQNLEQNQSIDLPDLDLPDPQSIAQYLRLLDPLRLDPGSWLDDSTQALTTEFGPAKVALRAGAIPFDLPDTFYARLRGEPVDVSRITSAAHARVYLRAIHDDPANANARADLVRVFLDRLDRQTEIMAALLWKGVRQLARSSTWRQLHPSIAFAFLCVWADRMASSIAAGNADPTQAAKNIRRTEPANLTLAFADPAAPVMRHVCETLGDPQVLAGALVGSILPYVSLAGLPPDLSTRLLDAIGNQAKDVWCPQFQIAFQRPSLQGAWITNDAVAAVMAQGAVPVLPPFNERNIDACIQAVLRQQVDPEHPFLLTGILSAADLSAVSPDTAQAIIAFVDKLLTVNAHRSNDAGYRHVQCIRSQCLGLTANRDEMSATMAKLASSFATTHRHQKTGYVIDPGNSPAHRDFAQLLEMAIAFARHLPGTRSGKIAAMGEIVAAIPDRWKGARHGVIEFLDRSTTMLDSEAVAALWPALLRVRQSP